MSTPARRRRAQAGVTLLELLIALAITGIIVVPISAWMLATLRQQHLAADVLDNAVDTGRLAAGFSRDVASARTIRTDASGDCVGGGGTVLLTIVSGGAVPSRVVYAEAPDGSSRSLWRRQCAPDGTLAQSTAVFSDILPGLVRFVCPLQQGVEATPSPVPPVNGQPSCDPASRRVKLSLQPQSPDNARQVELHAARRADAHSVGVPVGGNHNPIAMVTVSQLIGNMTTEFTFDGSSSVDPDGTPAGLVYEWELPEGELAGGPLDEPMITHRFSVPGSHTVLLKVTDPEGATNVAAVTVNVMNVYPHAVIGVSPETGGTRGQTEFQFDGSGSDDTDGPASDLSYVWDLGEDLGEHRFQHAPSFAFTFPADARGGLRQISLTVTDAFGGSDTAVAAISLDGGAADDITIDPPLVAVAGTSPRIGTVGAGSPSIAATFSGSPQGGAIWALTRASDNQEIATSLLDQLDYTFGSNSAGEYTITRRELLTSQVIAGPVVFRVNAAPSPVISVGAGDTAAPRNVQLTGSGSSDPGGQIVSWNWNFGYFGHWGSTAPDPTHVFSHPGRYTVILTVVDGDGASATATTQVDVTGTPSAPPAPTWHGQLVAWSAVPGADSYRVVLTCNSVPVTPDATVQPVANPTYLPPAGFCPANQPATAQIAVTANGVDGPLSTPAGRL